LESFGKMKMHKFLSFPVTPCGDYIRHKFVKALLSVTVLPALVVAQTDAPAATMNNELIDVASFFNGGYL